MRCAAFLVLGLAGCDLVFPPGASGDATADGPVVPHDDPDARGDAASAMHDEDFDDIPDAQDPCPHLAGDAADNDRDGVGDFCDPEPGVGHQRLYYFTGFATVATGLELTGDAQVAGDALALLGRSAGIATAYLPPAAAGELDNAILYTHFTIETVADVTGDVDVSVVGMHPGAGGTIYGASCRVGRGDPSATALFYRLHQQTDDVNDLVLVPTGTEGALPGLSADLRFQARTDTANINCDYAGTHLNQDAIALPAGDVGIVARGLDVRLDYLLVITTVVGG